MGARARSLRGGLRAESQSRGVIHAEDSVRES